MKKVLFVIGTSLQNAGVPHVVMHIVRALHDRYRFDVVVGGEEPGFFDEEFLSFGGQIFRCPLANNTGSKFGFWQKWRQLVRFVKPILSRQEYDVVHCHNGFEAAAVLRIATRRNVPIRVAHSHGYYPIGGKNILSRMYKIYCRKTINRTATARLACSTKAGDSLYGGAPYANVLNPIDLSYYQFEKEPHDGLNLIQIGYYNRLKNQLFSLRVLKELRDRGVPAALHFIGYSCGEQYVERMQEYVQKEGLTEAVHFLASDFPKKDILPRMDFLLLPSTSEGLPLVILEGQAARVCCVASSVVCKDVDMGLFHTLPIDSPSAWADFILGYRPGEDTLDTEKIAGLDIGAYVSKIVSVYEYVDRKE